MNSEQINVLLIEDDPGDADLLREILSENDRHSFTIEWVDRLQVGLERLSQPGIDVVLLDLSLPDSQGLETFVRVYAQVPNLPVVVLSGLDDEAIAIRAVRAGAQDYLVKGSVDSNLLIRALRYAIGRKRAETEVGRLYQAERARYREAEALRRVALALASTIDLGGVVERILVELQKVVSYDSASVMLLQEDKLDIVMHKGYRLGRRQFIPLCVDDLPHIQEMLQQRRPVIIPNTLLDSRWQRLSESEYMRCWLGVPLLVQDRVIGLLNLNKEEPNFYTERDEELATAFASHAAKAIENAQLFEQVRAGRERLQNLSSRLVDAQESERRHIARELHDEIGQVLTGLKLMLETSLISSTEVMQVRVSQALGLVNELTSRVQELSLDLRPSMLDDLGLLPTLAWHFKRYMAQTGVHVNFKYIGLEQRFTPDIETAVYRITQEALTNIARYAGVGEASVQLWVDQEQLWLKIKDEGKGFNAAAALATNNSAGLSGMQERMALLGGELTIDSAPDSGTSLVAQFPLPGPFGREKKNGNH